MPNEYRRVDILKLKPLKIGDKPLNKLKNSLESGRQITKDRI